MGRRYDDRRWIQNEDGSFTRRNQAIEQVVPTVAEQELQALEDPTNEELKEVIVNATKAAIELAQELGVDLSQIDGSGLHGKITKGDVEAASVSD